MDCKYRKYKSNITHRPVNKYRFFSSLATLFSVVCSEHIVPYVLSKNLFMCLWPSRVTGAGIVLERVKHRGGFREQKRRDADQSTCTHHNTNTTNTCTHINKGPVLAWPTIPWRTFNIHQTFPLEKRFFIVGKKCSFD